MRQVFFRAPWIHQEEPKELKAIYLRYGARMEMKSGSLLLNGGQRGVAYYLESGLGAATFLDQTGHTRLIQLTVPGRVLCDIAATTQEIINAYVYIWRNSIVYALNQADMREHIFSNPDLHLLFTKTTLGKQESNMEAMIANFTYPVSDRIKVFFCSLMHNYYIDIKEGWNHLPLGLTIDEYASFIGTTRVTVNRIFSEWKAAGLLKKVKRDMSFHSTLVEDVYDWVNDA